MSHITSSPCYSLYHQYFVKFPKEEDWVRFKRNAQRVQTLAMGQGLENTDTRKLQMLELCRPDPCAPLLPNLRELHWCDFKVSAFRYLSLFVHPGLTTFNALIISNPRLLSDTLAFLAKTAPALRSLKVSPGAPEIQDARFVSTLTKVLLSMSSLNELSLRVPVSVENLALLARLSRLEVLSARIPAHLDISSCGMPTDDASCFEALRKLTIYADSADDIIPFLSLVHSNSLADLLVFVKTQPDAVTVQHLFSIVARHKSLQNLSIMLTISAGPRSSSISRLQTSQEFTIDSDAIRQLLVLNELRHITLTQLPVHLDDRLLHDACRAWPFLERLSLGTMTRTDSPSVSLTAICHLTTHCTHLSELGLTINTSLGDAAYRKRKDGTCPADKMAATRPSQLKTFDVGCSPIRDMASFANFVARVLPEARVCDPHGPSYRKATMGQINAEVTALKAAIAN